MSQHLSEQWKDFALCKGMDTALFFPVHGHSKAHDKVKRICAECPVQEPCLDYAMRLSEDFQIVGLWAGTSQREREQVQYEKGIPIRNVAYDASLFS